MRGLNVGNPLSIHVIAHMNLYLLYHESQDISFQYKKKMCLSWDSADKSSEVLDVSFLAVPILNPPLKQTENERGLRIEAASSWRLDGHLLATAWRLESEWFVICQAVAHMSITPLCLAEQTLPGEGEKIHLCAVKNTRYSRLKVLHGCYWRTSCSVSCSWSRQLVKDDSSIPVSKNSYKKEEFQRI